MRGNDLGARLVPDQFAVVAPADATISELFMRLSELTTGTFDISPTSIDHKVPSIGIVTSMNTNSGAEQRCWGVPKLL